MNGFLNINKPEGISSFDVIRRLRTVMPRVKMGHLGTLDPLATGVLPIAVGWATKLIDYVGDHRKAYRAEMILGGVSDTQDCTGKITYIEHPPVDLQQVEAILERFSGEIEQIPPSFSAVHHQGKRLYELARQGILIEAEPRKINIYQMTLLQTSGEQGVEKITFEVECSSGTYVRTLCHDIGQLLGTGGYMNQLVRTRSGAFEISDAADLVRLTEDREYLTAKLLAVDYPLIGSDRIKLTDADAQAIKHGMTVKVPFGTENNELYVLYDMQDNLLALAIHSDMDGQAFLKPVRVVPEKHV
ncbi:MAG: tRNA pseudouridine(55) synthase TruB [Ignavibacteriales bacterium]